jgi:glycolate oxidase FAD binding subunit
MARSLLATARSAAGSDIVREPDRPDDYVDGVTPTVVIAPDTAEQVASTLAWASASRLSVAVRGAGTRDRWGRRPKSIDVLLRTDRLNRVIAHAPDDLTATVEAGAPLADVNAALGRQGQRLPLDGVVHGRGTVGGLLATNDVGPLRHRHGTARDLVIGMTFVFGDGLLASAGGRVVKNVAGFDLARMLTGSFGTLAVVTSATFKLAPLPPVIRTVRVTVRRPSDALALAEQLGRAHVEAESLEVIVHGGSSNVHVTVLARFASVRATVEDACRHVVRCAHDLDGEAAVLSDGDARAAWDVVDRWRQTETSRTVLRVSWAPSTLDKAVEDLRHAAGDCAITLVGRLAVGSGTITLDESAADHAGIVARLRAAPSLRHVTIVDAPADVRQAIDPWEIDDDTLSLWRALKTACDPHDILGAGRGPV